MPGVAYQKDAALDACGMSRPSSSSACTMSAWRRSRRRFDSRRWGTWVAIQRLNSTKDCGAIVRIKAMRPVAEITTWWKRGALVKSPDRLHGPEVVLVARKPEGMGVIALRLAAQKVHLKPQRIDGGLVLRFFAHKRGVCTLQHALPVHAPRITPRRFFYTDELTKNGTRIDGLPGSVVRQRCQAAGSNPWP